MLSNGFRFPQVGVVLSAVLILATQSHALAAPAPTARTLVIGVDHVDLTNQQPEKFRVFEYTDFFSRTVRIHTGDTLDFQTAPGAFHIVALARSEAAARSAYPFALLDRDDPPAIGSGKPKIELGPAAGSITNGTTHGGGTVGDPNAFPPTNCGLVQLGQSPCTFRGGDDVESQGSVAGFGPTGPGTVDWKVTINATPGTYDMFCYIHPGMRGKVTVVGNGEREAQSESDDNGRVTSQAQIDAGSAAQFKADREDALEAERTANVVHFRGEEPGERTYELNVGISAADNHVAIDEMLPQKLELKQGDRVHFSWSDPHNLHTVGFPTGSTSLPGSLGPDMEAPGEAFELVGDPGNAPAGTLLKDPTALVDAGAFLGCGFGLHPSAQDWSLRTDASTATGIYAFQCTIHDFMHGNLVVKS
jgi:plastocyanin